MLMMPVQQRFTLLPGLGGRIVHPLLRGPAILALNDGPFERENREAIQHLRIGSKRER